MLPIVPLIFPVPDRVLRVIGSRLPDRVLLAKKQAADAAYLVRLCRTPFTVRAREYQLADLAAANKVLASHPGFVVTAGGAR